LAKTLIDRIADLFQPQVPLWACELTSKHVIVAGVNGRRDKVNARLVAELHPGAVTGSLTAANIHNKELARSTVLETLTQARFEGSEVVVILPDDAVRIAFLNVEKLAKDSEEQQTFIRWKLKKAVPFDVETAQIAYQVLGTRRDGNSDLLVTLSPRSIVEEYESLFDSMNVHAGLVLPSTLAALNLFSATPADSLFLKIAPDCITTTIFQNGRIQFYRRVVDATAYDAVHPTIMYYHDKLGGKALDQVVVCGYDSDIGPAMWELQEKLGIVTKRLGPNAVDDIYKPALGGVHCVAI
jgi:type IV pilus assembly protein PilM